MPQTPEEWRDATPEERRIEAWRLRARGRTISSIGRDLGVSRTSIQGYLDLEAKKRLSRMANADIELERIAGVVEGVMEESFRRHEQAFDKGESSLAASNYLRLVLDSARELARLRGLDALLIRRGDTGPTKAEIVVRIGGAKDFEQVIEVGARVTNDA